MSEARSRRDPITASRDEAAAHARLAALFAAFDRLTPYDLERIGLRRRDGEARASMVQAVVEAAQRANRTALLDEARSTARDAVLRRYREGGLHPTWVGLNWGISQGTTEDRVAIVEALTDAAAAAVVADLVPAEVTNSLAIDADHILALASGEVSEGALAHAVEPPPAGMHDTIARRVAVWVGALAVGSLVFGLVEVALGGMGSGFGGAVAAGVVSAGIVVALARRDHVEGVVAADPGGRGEPDATER